VPGLNFKVLQQYAYSNEFIRRRRNPGARLQKISGIESNDSKKIACGLFKGPKGLTNRPKKYPICGIAQITATLYLCPKIF
jgi:hypothetical protein